MRAEDVLYEIADPGESQTVEFKTSLALQAKGIQTMVAFANSQGGWLFFGVTDDGTRKGVQIGTNTLERLAAAIRDHTYPSLPVVIEAIPSRDKRRHIIGVEVPSDVPPVIGVYVYSDKPIPLASPVDTAELQAYRRVGRMNQKEDFMRLRQPLPSDPRLRVQVRYAGLYTDNPAGGHVNGRVWAEEGSATAHGVVFRLEPFACETQAQFDDIPYPTMERSGGLISSWVYEGFTSAVDFEFPNLDFSTVPASVAVMATYKDDSGLTWEVRRRVSLSLSKARDRPDIEWVDSGGFRRRIVVFPPKVETVG